MVWRRFLLLSAVALVAPVLVVGCGDDESPVSPPAPAIAPLIAALDDVLYRDAVAGLDDEAAGPLRAQLQDLSAAAHAGRRNAIPAMLSATSDSLHARAARPGLAPDDAIRLAVIDIVLDRAAAQLF